MMTCEENQNQDQEMLNLQAVAHGGHHCNYMTGLFIYQVDRGNSHPENNNAIKGYLFYYFLYYVLLLKITLWEF